MSEMAPTGQAEDMSDRHIPAPGQLVEVRRRHWIVGDVQASTFLSRVGAKQHLLTLSSLDEDSLGQSIQVLWELEPGARILEKAGLPRIAGYALVYR